MRVKINGREEILDREMSIIEFIKEKGLTPEKLIVEYNYQIIPKEKWESIILKDDDNLEILSFVGGG